MAEVTKELLDRAHKAVFEMMCDIDDYCAQHNIVYYLSGGTCLGAARHQGFIPWDDDGDLMMPREDYERFLAGFGRAYEKKYRLGCFRTHPQWDVPHATVWNLEAKCVFTSRLDAVEMGFFVDIFPIDGLPAAPVMQKLHYVFLKGLFKARRMLIETGKGRNRRRYFFRRVYKKAAGFFHITPRRAGLLIEWCARRYRYSGAKYVAVVTAMTQRHPIESETLTREDMQGVTYLPFEGRKFPVFSGYRNYLANLFGPDYMSIPSNPKILKQSHFKHMKIEFNDEQKQTGECSCGEAQLPKGE